MRKLKKLIIIALLIFGIWNHLNRDLPLTNNLYDNFDDPIELISIQELNPYV